MNTRRALLLSSTMLGSAGGGLERTLHARQRAQLPETKPRPRPEPVVEDDGIIRGYAAAGPAFGQFGYLPPENLS